jgi:NAD(P)-dependent dehydrogenase (short-subunit alcohol dehydrogenase family)
MRIFLAGASGVIGLRLVPMLIAQGHDVAAMTRSPEKTERLAALGAEPVVCDVFDPAALTEAVNAFGPDMVMHQLTDLPDHLDQMTDYATRNDRVRSEGTRNLIAAARAAGAPRLLAQSIAWRPPGRGEIVDRHECQILDAGGVVVRYGQLYGPGTFYEHRPPGHPQVHVDAAAAATIGLLDAQPGVVVIAEDDHGHVRPRHEASARPAGS